MHEERDIWLCGADRIRMRNFYKHYYVLFRVNLLSAIIIMSVTQMRYYLLRDLERST
jgi:hypothetical protein